jgi:hypothetical protein
MAESTTPTEFEITGCHANRAGQASVTLRHVPTGATVAIHHVPFVHDYDENVREECQRIAATAAKLGERALAFLTSQFNCGAIVPSGTPGAAPNDAEPPTRVGAG